MKGFPQTHSLRNVININFFLLRNAKPIHFLRLISSIVFAIDFEIQLMCAETGSKLHRISNCILISSYIYDTRHRQICFFFLLKRFASIQSKMKEKRNTRNEKIQKKIVFKNRIKFGRSDLISSSSAIFWKQNK